MSYKSNKEAARQVRALSVLRSKQDCLSIKWVYHKSSPVVDAVSPDGHFADRVRRGIAYVLDSTQGIIEHKEHEEVNLDYTRMVELNDSAIVGVVTAIATEDVGDDNVEITISFKPSYKFVRCSSYEYHPRLIYSIKHAASVVIMAIDVVQGEPIPLPTTASNSFSQLREISFPVYCMSSSPHTGSMYSYTELMTAMNEALERGGLIYGPGVGEDPVKLLKGVPVNEIVGRWVDFEYLRDRDKIVVRYAFHGNYRIPDVYGIRPIILVRREVDKTSIERIAGLSLRLVQEPVKEEEAA